MKKIVRLLLVLLVIAGLSGRLSAEYLDVGDDPDKIQIANTMQLSVPVDYEFKGWSPDGEFFAFARRVHVPLNGPPPTNKFDQTLIYNKMGQQVKALDGAALLWIPNSTSLIMIDGRYELFQYNLKTNLRKDLDIAFVSKVSVKCIVPETGDLIYTIGYKIYRYNFTTEKSELIYQSSNLWGDVINSISKDDLIFEYRESKYNVFLYRYNMAIKKLSRFSTTTIHSDSYVFRTSFNKVIIYFDGDEWEKFIDDKGSAAFNFSSSVFQTSQKKFDEYPIGAHLDFSSFAPNGNIIAASVCKFNSDKGEFYFSDIYLVNRSGKMTKFTDTIDKKELVLGWSPQGNKIIYCDSRDVLAYFEDALTKYFMINLFKK